MGGVLPSLRLLQLPPDPLDVAGYACDGGGDYGEGVDRARTSGGRVIEWLPALERPPPIAQNRIGRLVLVLVTGMKVGVP